MLILVGLKTFTADYLPGPNAGTVAIVGAVRVASLVDPKAA